MNQFFIVARDFHRDFPNDILVFSLRTRELSIILHFSESAFDVYLVKPRLREGR